MCSTIVKLLVLSLGCILITDVSGVAQCKGRQNLLQEYNTACMNDGNNPEITETQSCLVAARKGSTKMCSSSSCTEVNIKMTPSTDYEDETKNLIWSFSSCYKQVMSVRVCTEGDIPKASTTLPPTTEGLEMNTTTVTTTVPPTTTGEMTTTTEPPTTETTTTTLMTSTETQSTNSNPTTTTAEAPTTLETDTIALSSLDGCYEGEVDFENAACAAKSVKVTLTSVEDSEMVEFTIEVLGCCTEDGCQVSASADETNTCNYGENSDVVSVSCSSACYTVLDIDADGNVESSHGCLSDFNQKELEPFTSVTACTATYEGGTCTDANNEEYCLRCCSANNCNNWASKDELLGLVQKEGTTTESGASAILPTFMLLAIGSFICYQ